MQPFSNKPRRRKARAAANPTVWHECLTRALLTALTIFIASQLFLAGLGSRPAIADVGDEIVLNDSAMRFGAAPMIAASSREAGLVRNCRLDVAAMKHAGGVLSVLQAGPAGVTLSWAGGPTAPGAANCQGGEIILSADDYGTLLKTGPKNINAR